MFKMLIAFLAFFVMFYVGIEVFRSLTRKEKWDTVKTVTYSLGIATIVVVSLIVIVVLF